MLERKPIRVYHYDGTGGTHFYASKAAENAKAALDILTTLPPTPDFIMATGDGVDLYHRSLHLLLKTAGQVAHPEEEAELERIHGIIRESRQMAKAHLS